MKIVFEPTIPDHEESLYRADAIACEGVAGWDAFTAADLAHYQDRGFVVVRHALNPTEVAVARDELRTMTLADDPQCGMITFEAAVQQHVAVEAENAVTPAQSQFAIGGTGSEMPPLPSHERARFVRKFMDFTAQHPPLHTLAWHPGILQVAERLLGEPATLFQEMAMIKPPNGREKPWHQDHAYFNFPLSMRIVGVWIALGDVRPENGCMFVLAGAHREGPRLHFLRRDWQICDTETRPLQQTAVPMQAGEVLFFDGKLPHGTPINRTDETRWALQFHYVPVSAHPTDDTARLAAFGSEGKDVQC
jgi:phytanoyl-CoA hydroxylase